MINSCSNLGIEGNFFNTIRNIYENPVVFIILNGERLNASPQDLDQSKYIYSPLVFNIVLRVLASEIKQEKWIKEQIDKKIVKVYFFADDMVTCVENPKEFIVKAIRADKWV